MANHNIQIISQVAVIYEKHIPAETAEFYAEILIRLETQDTPIPTHDIWIAAAAFQHGLKLFTRDRHFVTWSA